MPTLAATPSQHAVVDGYTALCNCAPCWAYAMRVGIEPQQLSRFANRPGRLVQQLLPELNGCVLRQYAFVDCVVCPFINSIAYDPIGEHLCDAVYCDYSLSTGSV